jgi:poly-gamma-glutamate synthesis protein (capsule biosynthesis protein)
VESWRLQGSEHVAMPSPDSAGPGAFDVVAVGDISLGDAAQGIGAGVHTTFERLRGVSRDYPFEHIAPLFDGADVVFGNLETVTSHAGLVRSDAASVEMRGHPDAAEHLSRAGFSILNVANNHIMQHGGAAFDETVQLLQDRGIRVAGVAAPDHRSCVPQTLTVNGLRLCVLGFAFEPDKYCSGPVKYAFGPDCDMEQQVRQARRDHDLVICSVHWGVEFVRHPAAAEEELGRRLIDAGAIVVLGHHPHVARRIDCYRGGLIAYSLGNFVFDQVWNRWLRTGLVLRMRLSRQGIETHGIDWVWIGDDFQPQRLTGTALADAIHAFQQLADRPASLSADADYAREYERLVAVNRYESYRHFLRNLPRRPISYTMQTLLRTARRKGAAALGPRSPASSSPRITGLTQKGHR